MECCEGLTGCHSSVNQLCVRMFNSLQIPLKEVASRIMGSMVK